MNESTPLEEKPSHNLEILPFQATATTQESIKKSPDQSEDGYAIGQAWAMVADGMGGHEQAQAATQALIEDMTQGLNAIQSNLPLTIEKLVEQIENVFTTTHQHLKEQYLGTGTTVAVSMLLRIKGQPYLFVAWTGDVRVYLESTGHLRRVSIDHAGEQSQLNVSNEVFSRVLEEYDMLCTIDDLQGASQLVRSLRTIKKQMGKMAPKHLGQYFDDESGELTFGNTLVPVNAEDTVLILSDGVPTNLTTSEIHNTIHDLPQMIAQARQRSSENGFRSCPDDMTVVRFTVPAAATL